MISRSFQVGAEKRKWWHRNDLLF